MLIKGRLRSTLIKLTKHKDDNHFVHTLNNVFSPNQKKNNHNLYLTIFLSCLFFWDEMCLVSFYSQPAWHRKNQISKQKNARNILYAWSLYALAKTRTPSAEHICVRFPLVGLYSKCAYVIYHTLLHMRSTHIAPQLITQNATETAGVP